MINNMIKKILILILLITNATALNDINLTIDGGTYELCLTHYQTQNQTCNITESLTLDGTQDHYIEFTPRKVYSSERDLKDWILSPINFFVNLTWAFYPFILILGGGLIAILSVFMFIKFMLKRVR